MYALRASRLGMPLKAPCWDFVTRWMVGPAHPPSMVPGSRSGCRGLPNWVLGVFAGLRASAVALGAGTKVLFLCNRPPWRSVVEAGGQSPGRVREVTPRGLSVNSWGRACVQLAALATGHLKIRHI